MPRLWSGGRKGFVRAGGLVRLEVGSSCVGRIPVVQRTKAECGELRRERVGLVLPEAGLVRGGRHHLVRRAEGSLM